MRIDSPAVHALLARPAADAGRPPFGVARGRADGPAGIGPDGTPPGHRAPEATPPPAAATAPAPAALTLEGLIDAWGQNGSVYDLNQDSTVDVYDLVKFIEDWPHQDTTAGATPAGGEGAGTITPDAAPTDGTPVALEPGTPAGRSADEPLTLEGLIHDWGQSDSPYDLDGNRTVDVRDLVEFIIRHSAPPTANAEGPGARPAPSARDDSGVRSSTDALLSRLNGAGFRDRLPVNVDQLIDTLTASADEKHAVARNLARAYPNGIGLRLEG